MQLSKIETLSDQARECVDNCLTAAAACEWCADACAGDEEMAQCLRLCRDVADLTTLHARLMLRDSSYSGELAALCATACDACAKECANHEQDHCQLCASVLPACAETCRAMASA